MAATAPRCNNAAGCQGVGKMQCPTCLKANRPEILSQSYFCSQECFKASWSIHKALHVDAATYNPWPQYRFTGALRPWPPGPRRFVPKDIKRPDYAEDGIPYSEQSERGNNKIQVLTPEEIEKARTVCRLTREVLDLAAAAVKPGVTTDEIDRIVHDAVIARNAYPSPYNYHNYPRSVCTSINEVICHGIPDMRPLQDGDIVNIDVSLFYDGYHGDLNETYFVGSKVDAVGQKLVNVTRECLEKAIEMVGAVKPGVPYRDLGNVISQHAESNGFSVVRAFTGHGVNTLFHAAPNIPHYAKNKAVGVMAPGHCFTIEPMICEGTYQEKIWPDDWTATTTDGKRSAQFEQTILVTETGYEILTAAKIPGLDSAYSSVYFNQKQLESGGK